MSETGDLKVAAADYADVDQETTVRANRSWWDWHAPDYYAEHGSFLGDRSFRWCPEGLVEEDAKLLGEVADARVLEVGCGAAQCGRWLTDQGAHAVGIDLSAGMLARGRTLNADLPGPGLIQADATHLPFADESFDIACSAFGAVPFVRDGARLMREVARVLRPGGRWVFAISHPIRWCFPDDGGPAGLTINRSYYDSSAYRERDKNGRVIYAEHPRTLGQRISEVVQAGFILDELVEPEWTAGDAVWGSWTRLRGELFPGTAIFRCHKG